MAHVDISKRGPPTKWRTAAIGIKLLLLIELNSRYYEERLLFGAEKPVSCRQMLKVMSEQTVQGLGSLATCSPPHVTQSRTGF